MLLWLPSSFLITATNLLARQLVQATALVLGHGSGPESSLERWSLRSRLPLLAFEDIVSDEIVAGSG